MLCVVCVCVYVCACVCVCACDVHVLYSTVLTKKNFAMYDSCVDVGRRYMYASDFVCAKVLDD